MTRATKLQGLADLVRRLHQAMPPWHRVLSVYLDTSPEGVRRKRHLLQLIDGFKTLRAQLPAAELDRFEAAAAQAESYISKAEVQAHWGLAVFAGGTPGYFYAVPLPRPPEEGIAWGEHAVLAPLHEVLDDYERVAVLLFDQERARLLAIRLGEVEAARAIEDEAPRKQAVGGWYGLAQARIARHREDHVLRHVKRAIAMVMEELRTRPFDRLLVGGPEEALALLKPRLPGPLRARLAGSIKAELFAGDAAVVEKALQAVEAIERKNERAEVQELLDSAASRSAVLGTEPALEALAQGRVLRLLIAQGAGGPGSACRVCGRLTAGLEGCPSCGGDTEPLDDLRERVVAQALDGGASIEFVSGEAARLLLAHGGLGAWTRY